MMYHLKDNELHISHKHQANHLQTPPSTTTLRSVVDRTPQIKSEDPKRNSHLTTHSHSSGK